MAKTISSSIQNVSSYRRIIHHILCYFIFRFICIYYLKYHCNILTLDYTNAKASTLTNHTYSICLTHFFRNLNVLISHISWVLPSYIILTKINNFFVPLQNKIHKKIFAWNLLLNNHQSNTMLQSLSFINLALKSKFNLPSISVSDHSEIINTSDETSSGRIPVDINAANQNISTNSNSNLITPTHTSFSIDPVKRYGRKEHPSFWKSMSKGGSDWMTLDATGCWVWWVIGGYSASVVLFRMADWLNAYLVPSEWFEVENIVEHMIGSDYIDLTAILVGSLAPCVSAPWWEEVRQNYSPSMIDVAII